MGGGRKGRAQKLCESRGGRAGLPSLISLRYLRTKATLQQQKAGQSEPLAVGGHSALLTRCGTHGNTVGSLSE